MSVVSKAHSRLCQGLQVIVRAFEESSPLLIKVYFPLLSFFSFLLFFYIFVCASVFFVSLFISFLPNFLLNCAVPSIQGKWVCVWVGGLKLRSLRRCHVESIFITSRPSLTCFSDFEKRKHLLFFYTCAAWTWLTAHWGQNCVLFYFFFFFLSVFLRLLTPCFFFKCHIGSLVNESCLDFLVLARGKKNL